MKTHIALVGGQPVPVYLGIKSCGDVDRIIMVCSEQTRGEAQRLISYFENVDSEIVICNPVDLSEIENCATLLVEKVKDDKVILNLTSGTKPWTLVFYRYFMSLPNAQFVLVDQNNRIQNLHTHKEKVENIDKEVRFSLYGTPLRHYRRFSDYTEEDFVVCHKVEKLRKINYDSFKDLTSDKHAMPRCGKSKELPDGSYVEWNREAGIVDFCLYNFYSQKLTTTHFVSKHAVDIVFNNSWFELKTAMELSKNTEVKDIWMNCEFAAKGKMPKNEIDIILDMGKKLFFVECKTQVYEITAIDKFHSAIKNFSGTSSKGIFVVNDYPSAKNSRYSTAMEKCKDNDILTFNFAEYNNTKDSAHPMPALNDIINDNLNSTNTR